MINNEDWKLMLGYVLSQIASKEGLWRWELKIRKLAASSKTSSKSFNILGIVTLNAQSAVLLAVRGMPKVCLKLALVDGRFLKWRLDSSRSKRAGPLLSRNVTQVCTGVIGGKFEGLSNWGYPVSLLRISSMHRIPLFCTDWRVFWDDWLYKNKIVSP